MSDNTINSTSEYSKFKILKGNREISRVYLKRLVKSIKADNRLASNPIIINEKWEVVDGQHRLQAAQALELPIYYVVAPHGSLNTIHLLNATVRKWTITDYLDSYAKLGIPAYIEIKNIIAQSPKVFSPSTLIGVLERGRISNGGASKTFTDGTYTIKHKDVYLKIVDYYNQLKPFIQARNVTDYRKFLESVRQVFVVREIQVSELINQLISSGLMLTPTDSLQENLREFENVLNYNRKIKIRLF